MAKANSIGKLMSNKYIKIIFALMFIVPLTAMENPRQFNKEIDPKYFATQLIEDLENNRESTWFIQEDLSEEEQEMIKKALARYFSNKLWRAFAKEICCKELKCKKEVFMVAVSNDNRFIVTDFYDGGSAQILDMQTEEAVDISRKQRVAKSNGGNFKVVVFDKIAEIWNLQSDQHVCDLAGHNSSINSVAINKDDNFIFTYSWEIGIIKIWNAQTYELLHSLNVNYNCIESAISKDNKLKAYITDGAFYQRMVIVVDLESEKLVHSLSCSDSATSVVISSDNNLIISGDLERKVTIWDAQTGNIIHSFITAGPKDNDNLTHFRPTYIALSEDNAFIVTDSFESKMAKIWYLPLDQYSINQILEKIRESSKSFFSSLWDSLGLWDTGLINKIKLKPKYD